MSRLIFSDLQPRYKVPSTFTDQDLKTIKYPMRLKVLELHNNANVTDAGLAILGERFKNLEVLDLDGTSISDEGLSCLGPLSQLRELWIEQTSITDNGLLRLKDLSRLEFVSIIDTPVTPAGVAALKKFLPGCEIR